MTFRPRVTELERRDNPSGPGPIDPTNPPPNGLPPPPPPPTEQPPVGTENPDIPLDPPG